VVRDDGTILPAFPSFNADRKQIALLCLIGDRDYEGVRRELAQRLSEQTEGTSDRSMRLLLYRLKLGK
jgi:hypothetical protein